MSFQPIETERLFLVLPSLADVRAQIAGMSEAHKAQVSSDWLAMVESATTADPWVHGFVVKQRSDDTVVGQCGFKGPPADGAVEIAYAIDPGYQGRGYATEAAGGMTSFAFDHDEVRLVRAHTLPEPNASTRVLEKCEFEKIGEVTDPEDGQVWRWEKSDSTAH